MGDLGCAVVSQGIVVMREWKVKDAQWKVCDWTISMCVAQRDKALQTIDGFTLLVASRVIRANLQRRKAVKQIFIFIFPF